MRSVLRLFVCIVLLLSACNLPQQQAGSTARPPLPAAATPGAPGLVILSPADGARLPAATPVQVQFSAAGGPFIEADLFVDNVVSVSQPLASDDPAPSGTLAWNTPTAGTHTLTVEILTSAKQVYTAAVQLVVLPAEGSAPASAAGTNPTPTDDPARANARQQVIRIMHDTYHIDLSAPPITHKSRQGVSSDPWVSVIFTKNWMYTIEIYPDKVVESPHPIDQFSDGSVPVPPDQKAFPVCRPAGTLKILVAFVDFQNLGVTRQAALDSLAKAAAQLNADFARYSTAGGAAAPILQLQLDGVFLSPAPAMPDHLLTPAQIKSLGGLDPGSYDLRVQVDLDANNTYRKILAARNFDTFGFTQAACHDTGLSIWIALDNKAQALGQDPDRRLASTLGHELLHTFGYPFGHTWPCGDGSTPDAADECDVSNWPTLILGWTDTDGDGLPEILDPTPYGMASP